MINSLSGRFLILTVIFVMLAEVLIFVPSIARFRYDWLQERLELSQIASLALLATPNDMVTSELETELLENAEVLNIVLRRDAVRELVLMSPMDTEVADTFDLRTAGPPQLMWDALRTIFAEDRVIRVIGMPVKGGGIEIETTLREAPLRDAMMQYGLNILMLSLFISAVTATLLFFVVRGFMVKPIERVVANMMSYRDNPEDARRIMTPTSNVTELRAAETALSDLQTQLTQSLRQKERLAALGGAVARISHDLRNMLTTAQLFADRMERSDDPTVKRVAPKLLGSLNRAINLCEGTLTFGKAEEPAPVLTRILLNQVVEDVLDHDRLRSEANSEASVEVRRLADIPPGLSVDADGEQLYRVLSNLVGNARQAIEATGNPGEVRVEAALENGATTIWVKDTGPGLPAKAQEHLFQPFQGRARRDGTGLGLAISNELIRGHGGALRLVTTGENGTTFELILPQRADAAA